MGGSALTPLAFRRPIMVPQYLTLDFNAPSAIRRVRYTVLGLGIVALLAGGMELAVAWQAREQAHAELASLDKRQIGRGAAARSGPVDGAALRVAAAIARDLQAPWPELMRSMEASRSSDIALVQVEPVVARDSIRITGDARHAEAMLDYLEQLTEQGLSDVVLTSHQIRPQEPGSPIRFQAQARWTSLVARSNAAVARGETSPVASTAPGSDLAALQRYLEQERDTR